MQTEAVILPERFMRKVALSPNDGCWEWRGAKGRGYGLWTIEGRLQPAHRIAYRLVVGPVPSGHVVMHRCDNGFCVRPDHLTTGTQKENIADMDRKGRRALYSPKKLTLELAMTIRVEAGTAFGNGPAMRAIAAKYGISVRSVREIRKGRTWDPAARGRIRGAVVCPVPVP